MPEQDASVRGSFSTIANVGLLLGGFGFGQGTIFIAQTWLVAIGEFHVLAAFGTHFLFAVLGTFVVDAGSITTLARHAAALPRNPASPRLWQIFSDTAAFRVAVALILVAAAIAYAFSPLADGFSRSYALAVAPGLLFFAGNAAGLLDGLKFSGVSGTSGAIPYATSALALILTRHASPEVAGAVLGAAFSVGCLLTVAAQWIVLTRFGWQPRRGTMTAGGFLTAAREGGAMLGVLLPGQLYGRAQVILSATYLGVEATALFLYVKQILAGVTQVIAFIQRAEFPVLVKGLSSLDAGLFRTILGAQKLAVAAAVLATVAVLAAGLVMTQWPESRFGAIAPLLCAFSPTILTMSAALMLTLALAATGAYEGLAFDIIIFNLIGTAASYLFLNGLGVYAFVGGDILSTVCGVLMLGLRLGKSRQNFAVAVGRQP